MAVKSDTLWHRELLRAKRRILEAALARNRGYVVATAHELGITETLFYRYCKELGIDTRPHAREADAPIAPRLPPKLSGWLATAAAAHEEKHDETDED